MKYIMFLAAGIELPFLFPDWVQHDQVTAIITNEVVSAGFVQLKDGDIKCSGVSISLNIPSRPEDTRIIKEYLETEPFVIPKGYTVDTGA